MLFPIYHNRCRYTTPVSLRKWVISKSFFCWELVKIFIYFNKKFKKKCTCTARAVVQWIHCTSARAPRHHCRHMSRVQVPVSRVQLFESLSDVGGDHLEGFSSRRQYQNGVWKREKKEMKREVDRLEEEVWQQQMSSRLWSSFMFTSQSTRYHTTSVLSFIWTAPPSIFPHPFLRIVEDVKWKWLYITGAVWKIQKNTLPWYKKIFFFVSRPRVIRSGSVYGQFAIR